MAIIEGVAVGLGVHLGKLLIDKVWTAIQDGKALVANQDGNLGLTTSHGGRTLVGTEFTTPKSQVYELVVGSLYIPSTITDWLAGDEIPLVLIIEETRQEVIIFTTDLNAGYEIALPHGIYSFYVFLMESDADDFYDAEIYAVGLPSKVDLSNVEKFDLKDHDDIWDIVSDFPVKIHQGGPYALDIIFIDTDKVPEFPKSFSEILGDESEADLTGTWELNEKYEFGDTTAFVYLVHVGDKLHGLMVIQDEMDDGTGLVIQETVYGKVEGENVFLSGTGVRVIEGESGEYNLDHWEGVVETINTISGNSEDMAGITGSFVMRRVG